MQQLLHLIRTLQEIFCATIIVPHVLLVIPLGRKQYICISLALQKRPLFSSLILVAAGCRVLLLPPPDPLPKGRGSLAAHTGGLLYCAIVGFIYHYFKEQWQCCQFRIQHFDWHVYLRSVSIVSEGIVRCHFLGFIFLQAGCLCTRAYRNRPYKLI